MASKEDENLNTVISQNSEDGSEDSNQRSLLRFVPSLKKSLKASILAVKITEQVDKLQNTIMYKGPKKKKPPQDTLATPSSILPMPSDFEHVFHAQQNEQLGQPIVQTNVKQKSKIIGIPIYTGDDSLQTKILNMPLDRFNQFAKDSSGKSIKPQAHRSTMPLIKKFSQKINQQPKLTLFKQQPTLKRNLIQQPKLKQQKKQESLRLKEEKLSSVVSVSSSSSRSSPAKSSSPAKLFIPVRSCSPAKSSSPAKLFIPARSCSSAKSNNSKANTTRPSISKIKAIKLTKTGFKDEKLSCVKIITKEVKRNK